MRKLLVIGLTLALCGFRGALTTDQPGGPAITNAFASMQLWGGGFVVGQDSPISGVHFVRTDSFGAYLRGNDNKWHQVITKSSFATAICSSATLGSCFGYFPTTGTSQIFQGSAAGVVEISGAPSDATIAYMFYGGLIYKSTNVDPANPDGITWINTNQLGGGGFTKTNDGSNVTNRINGRFMAVDPNNSSHVFVGTQGTGLWETKDGGSTFAQISASDIPTAVNSTNYNIAFDPASGTTGGLTNTIYVFTSGTTAGVYKSTTGGGTGTWSLTTSGPISVQHMVVAQTGGLLWAVSGAPNAAASALLKYNGTAWSTEIAANASLHSVAVNPSNVNHIVALGTGGSMRTTTTGSGGFGALFAPTIAAGDAPWQAVLATNIFGPTAADISLDGSDNIMFDGGQGIWTTTLPSGNFTLTANVAGVMQPIGQQVVVPKALTAVSGFQDLGSCTMTYGLPPTACIPITQYKSLEFASGLDVSKTDQNFMVAKISSDFNGLSDYSGYSNDGFVTDYHAFNTYEVVASAASAVNNNGSGLIRITGSTTGLTTWAAGSGSIVCSYANSPAQASALSNGAIACYPVTVIDSTHFDLQGSTFSSGLTTIGGNYTLYAPPPTILSNWAGSLNVVGTASDSGKIQITYLFDTVAFGSQNSLTNGAPVYITGVLGTTEANGYWTVSNLNTTNRTFDLGPTSTFANAYTGGGVAATWQEPGGAIAAASDTNVSLIAANGATAPKCSTDGGKTWADITGSALPVALTTVATGGGAGTTSIVVNSVTGISNGQVVKIVMDDGRVFYTKVTAIVSTTLTVAPAVPTGANISSGAKVYRDPGWVTGAGQNSHIIAADWSTPNTFYAVNFNGGMFSWTNCGAATLVNSASSSTSSIWLSQGNANTTLKTVPGKAGHLFWTAGPLGAPNQIGPQGLWQGCDGGTTMTFRLRNVFGAQFFGFGATKAGSTYPTIYYVGWYDATNANSEAAATFGIWRSTDNPGDCSGSGTFQKLTDWPLGWMVTFKDITGDPTWPSVVYINTGAGPFSGTFN